MQRNNLERTGNPEIYHVSPVHLIKFIKISRLANNGALRHRVRPDQCGSINESMSSLLGRHPV